MYMLENAKSALFYNLSIGRDGSKGAYIYEGKLFEDKLTALSPRDQKMHSSLIRQKIFQNRGDSQSRGTNPYQLQARQYSRRNRHSISSIM